MCAGGNEICTAVFSFQGLKRRREEEKMAVFVANESYAEGSSFGAATRDAWHK